MTSRTQTESDYARTLLPLARMWRQAADRALTGFGVSASLGWGLIQIGRLGNDVRQTDLAGELDITGASVVRLLDQMVAAGLVERGRDPADARVSRVRLTAAGEQLATEIEHALATLRRDILGDIAEADLATALAVAETLAASFARRRAR